MSTERFSTDSIISSQVSGGATERLDTNATQRVTAGIIGSGSSGSSSLTGKNIHLNQQDYLVTSLIASSGEAEVFLVEQGNRKLVMKWYFSNFKPKDEVVQKLQKLKRSDIIFPIDQGYFQDRFWELNEYLAGGTLADEMPVRDIKRIREIVQKVTQALKACHQNNIIHRDIKPVNIFFRDAARTDFVLGDFGIASAVADGSDYRVTTVARTTTYAAPELFTNINNQTTLDYKVDFYALGITLLELWKGEDPFKDIAQFKMMRMKTEGQVPIPADIFNEVEDLIKGLLTTEPPKRWGYDEVEKWLKGEPVKNYYQRKEVQFEPYEFDAMQGQVANDTKELAFFMEKNPVKAERQLYSGAILNWIKSGSEDLYSEIHDIVNNSYKQGNPDNVKAGITKTIYLLDKDRPFKSFGETFYSAADLGAHLEKQEDHFVNDLKNPSASVYLFLEARGLQDRADTYRKYFKQMPAIKAFRLVTLDMQENKLIFNGYPLDNISQLSNPPATIESDLLKAIADENSKVSVWLSVNSPAHSAQLEIWRKLKDYSLQTLRYALNTGGLPVNGKEVMDAREFQQVFANEINFFTTHPDAASHRDAANYWLMHYQQSSLPAVCHQYINSQQPAFQLLQPLYEYLLSMQRGKNPLDTTRAVSNAIKAAISVDQETQQLADLTGRYFKSYYKEELPYHVYAIELLEETAGHLKSIQAVYPELAKKLLNSVDDSVSEGIHTDLKNLQSNSDSFNEYMDRLQSFFEGQIKTVSSESASYQHWQNEQKLIQRRFADIDSRLEKQKSKELNQVNDKFDKYLKNSIDSQIDFLRKGKSFYVTFMILVSSIICFIYLESVFRAPSFSFFNLFIGIILVLFFRWMIKAVWRRSPDRGLGTIMDPIHRMVGRLVYRPIYSIIRNDPNSSLHLQTQQSRKSELDKVSYKTEGQKSNEHFEETVKVMLMDDSLLRAELSKN